jgi:DNA-binding transcriptional LysR family regulator
MTHSLERIQTFVKVVETNSFVGVAQRMNLSRAAISKQISFLEQELGIKLIERSTRRLKLTEAGALYYEKSKQLLELIDEMDEFVTSIRKEPAGTLKLFCARYFGEHVVVPHLGEFMEANPKVKINLWLEERIPDLVKEEVDILIGVSMPGPPEAIRRTIAKTRYIFCASPGYLQRFGIPQKPIDLIHHRYITHAMRQPDDVLVFGDLELNLDPYLRINDAWAMLKCALNGVGIVKLHDYIVEESLQAGNLIEILQPFSQEEYAIFIYYMQNRYLSPKIRHFIDFLLNRLSKS